MRASSWWRGRWMREARAEGERDERERRESGVGSDRCAWGEDCADGDRAVGCVGRCRRGNDYRRRRVSGQGRRAERAADRRAGRARRFSPMPRPRATAAPSSSGRTASPIRRRRQCARRAAGRQWRLRRGQRQGKCSFFRGTVDLRASLGQTGTLLLDPDEITIVHDVAASTSNINCGGGGTCTTPSGGPFTDIAPNYPPTGGILSDGTINAQLNPQSRHGTNQTHWIPISNSSGTVAIGPTSANAMLTLNSATNIAWNAGCPIPIPAN